MPLADQPISITYGKGLDSKTNKFTVPTGKLLQLQDAVFTNPMELEKRPGNTIINENIFGGGTFANPLTMSNFNEELLCTGTATGATYNGQRIFSYSETETAWVDKGKYTPLKVTTGFVNQTIQNQYTPSTAVLNNISIFASTVEVLGSVVSFFPSLSVIDMATNDMLLSNSPLGTANLNVFPTCVNLGGTQLAVLYEASNGGLSPWTLILQTITVTSGGGVVLGPQVTLGTFTETPGPPDDDTQGVQYYVQPTATGAVVAFDTTIITIDTTGTILHTVTAPATTNALAVDPNTNDIWAYFISNSTPFVRNIIYTSTLGVSRGITSLITSIPGHVNGNTLRNITAVTISTNLQQFAFTYLAAETSIGGLGPSTPYIHHVFQALTNSAGSLVVHLTELASYAALYSNYFLVQDYYGNNIPYIGISNAGTVVYPYVVPNTSSATYTLQPTLFIMDATLQASVGTSAVVGKAFVNSTLSTALSDISSNFAIDILSNLTPFNSTQVIVPAISNIGSIEIPQGSLQYAYLDFANQDTSQALSIPNKSTLFNGGIVTMYDGQSAVELGFNAYPEILQMNETTTVSGALTPGTYSVYPVFQWTDALGNLHQSAAIPQTIIVDSGGSNSITLTIPYLTLTQKTAPRQSLGIAIYCTAANEVVPYLIPNYNTGAPYYANDWTNAPGTVFPVPGQSVVTAIINAVNTSNPILYTSGGVLDNDPPPPTTAMVVHNNRVQVVDSTNPNSQWYSKSMTPGVGISFSGDLLNQIDPHAGSIVALAEMDDKLVLFAQNAPIVISGDGPNDAGQGGNLSFPQFIPSDVGCSQSKGVLTSPLGVHFKTPKGIYLLDRSLGLKYWGSPVEKYNAQTITSSLIMPGKTQIRFLTSGGLTLVYDYFQDQWGTFTNTQGYGATIWNGLYVYCRTDGNIYQENTTGLYTDNGASYPVIVQFGWLKGDVIQGFERLKELLNLGEYSNGSSNSHGLQVTQAYDYGTNPSLPGFSDPLTYTFNASTNTGVLPFQFRYFPVQQKCESTTVLIEEIITPGVSGEYLTLTDMTGIIAGKKGAFKLPSGQSAT